ncbi:DinB family protein [Streptomyces jeddahensis]|uniref:DinB superfamily protein n=1 Tax=Streptomyces jeddahensis TaxID=1716141 RepID=A0A177HY43_9ACTN|nr:DinB family protein [Streptomyces jeddahensis]OAH15509.1 DinB superfamily protein [Streptomyces jeddahensis]
MTTQSTHRTETPTTAGERAMLEAWLEFHRTTLAMKCEGLDDEQLRRASVPPSDLTLLGLVRHMAEVERAWFRRVLANEDAPPIYYTDADRDGDFHLTESDTREAAFPVWQAEIEAARALAAQYELDDLATGKHRSGEPFNLRWIYVHMIEEYARHNGHADLLRECIDGTTGD